MSISNMVCRAMTALCQDTPLVLQHGSCEKKGIFYLVTAVRNSLRNPIFCCHAINCIVNLTNKNDPFRQHIIMDEYNQKLVQLIIDALELYRYANRHTKHEHCVKVQVAGSMALQNIAAHPMGQSLVGTAGVDVLLDSFVAHVESTRVLCLQDFSLQNSFSSTSQISTAKIWKLSRLSFVRCLNADGRRCGHRGGIAGIAEYLCFQSKCKCVS